MHLLQVRLNLLCILGADQRAGSTKHAFVFQNACLIVMKGDGFHRTVTDTFIAIFAISFFQLNDAHGVPPWSCVCTRDDFLLNETDHTILVHMVELGAVHLHTGTILAFAHAEAGTQLHLVL